jgi:hypothetical protein
VLISKTGADGYFGTADAPILLAAMKAEVGYLVTHNRVHFTDDPVIAVEANLRIRTPENALNWMRRQISSKD